MKKRNLFSLFMALFATAVIAQSVPTHEKYVDDGRPDDIVKALDEWEPGKPWNGDSHYNDENFWISRVPLKNRFRPGDHANDALNDENNKKFCWCAPTGEMTSKWGALPRYNFDGDNFNMWQYLEIHSNWTNGFWRVPGAFNDVAHKNGVKTGCTYFIDWGATVSSDFEPGQTLYKLAEPLSTPNDKGDQYKYSRKLIQFLKYYGIDGLCFNPEGYWHSAVYSRVIPFLAECHKVAEELNHPFHVDWYSFVTNNGNLSDNSCRLTSNNQDWFQYNGTPVTDVFFLNYNWTASGLQQSVETAKSLGRSSFDVYAGFDMQGRGYGQGSNAGTNAGWKALMENPVSIVIWGAHDRNQLYISSTEGGQSDYAVQNEYQKKQEMLFSGGNRNVLSLPKLDTKFEVTSSYSDLKDWHGYATAVIERSTLDEVPFVTRFNLGNGRFFNNEGVTTWNHKWYNYGMQDFLPTWRWWVDKGDGKTVPADAINLNFTFDDAWFGGSCLKVSGATVRSDVRLFATKWNVADGDDFFRLVFKPNSNATHLELMVAKENGESKFVYVPVAGNIKGGEWNEVVIKASEAGLAVGDVIGCVGLSVKDTDAAYEVLLGELAYIPAGFNTTPKRPTVEYSEVIKRYYNRADVKIVFSMPEPTTRKPEYEGCPIYNEEVGVWYYEIWIRQGKNETLLTTTTSWASYVVDATLIEGSTDGIRIGVRAVGLDGRAKSDIKYGDVQSTPLSIIETLTIDKDIIKPNEEFTIGFEDPNHPLADIKIYDAVTGEVVVSAEKVTSMTTSLPTVGSYDVEVNSLGDVMMNRSLILVTPEETGRYPEIKTLEADKSNVDAGNVKYQATISKGDLYNDTQCTVSQSLYMQEPYQFTVDAAIMSEYKQTSFALWFKVEKFEHASLGTLLMTKVNRNYKNDWNGTWTDNVWGEMWTAIRPAGYAADNNIGRNNADNELSLCTDAPPAGTSNYEHNRDVDILSNGYSLMPGVWYHVCAVKQNRNLSLYLNGMLIAQGTARGAGPKDWKGAKFYVGGSMTNLASLTGWVDEVQIWSKALTAEEVKEAMKGYNAPPANLEGYFTFEKTEVDSEGFLYFPNMGRNKSVVPGGYMTTGKEENGRTTDYKQNQFTTALGVPMITGSYPINYESSKWFVEGAKLNASTETTAEITDFNASGEYEVKLVATNSWGTATKVVKDCIVVTAIDDVAANEAGYMIYPKPFEGVANVLFAKGGTYDIAVYAADGKLVARDFVEVNDSEVREVSVETAGTYVVVISKDGKAVRSFKIMM